MVSSQLPLLTEKVYCPILLDIGSRPENRAAIHGLQYNKYLFNGKGK